MLAVVVEVEVETLDFSGAVGGEAVGGEEGRDLVAGEGEDDLEAQRCAFATDDLEAVVTDLRPAGVGLFWFFVEEVFLQIAVYSEFIEGSEFAFDEEKGVKGVF